MGHTLTYRSCSPVDPGRDAAIRQAADAFNRGREWILAFATDPRDAHLMCTMEPSEAPTAERSSGNVSRWPGPYEAKCLLDALCAISRDCGVDWEIRATYSQRPVGTIRGGQCYDDPEAHAEAIRHMRARLDREV